MKHIVGIELSHTLAKWTATSHTHTARTRKKGFVESLQCSITKLKTG
jgi:hypothetical protein